MSGHCCGSRSQKLVCVQQLCIRGGPKLARRLVGCATWRVPGEAALPQRKACADPCRGILARTGGLHSASSAFFLRCSPPEPGTGEAVGRCAEAFLHIGHGQEAERPPSLQAASPPVTAGAAISPPRFCFGAVCVSACLTTRGSWPCFSAVARPCSGRPRTTDTCRLGPRCSGVVL